VRIFVHGEEKASICEKGGKASLQRKKIVVLYTMYGVSLRNPRNIFMRRFIYGKKNEVHGW
jgi:hypothetical protein